MKKYLFLLLFIFGCEPLDGIVVNKCTVPEHTETQWITMNGGGKNSIPISFPLTIKIETQYFIEIKDKNGFRNKIRLTEEEYKTYDVNDKYPHREKP